MILLLLVFLILTATLFMLSLDRSMGMHFFTADMGGNAMMYINLIWAWGPEVYVLVLPALVCTQKSWLRLAVNDYLATPAWSGP